MKELGYAGRIAELLGPLNLASSQVGRVIVEHKERYVVQTLQGAFKAEITGNLRYSASQRQDFPAVGDWVKLTMMDEETAIILEVLPRFSLFERRAVGKTGESQIIATNIDLVFIVQSVGHDFNLNRMERYLALCSSSGIDAIILLTKTDLSGSSEVAGLVSETESRIKNIPVVAISNETLNGFDRLNELMEPYLTYCFLGSSGVGKSTIINHLLGNELLKTSSISSSTNKGKHTTSQRELIILPNKSIVIDTAGMREIGMTDNEEGIELTYDQITDLSHHCRFHDCTHTNETDCAVLDALEKGGLSEAVYENYQKLKREQAHFSSTAADKKRKDKELGKLIKSFKSKKNSSD
jgi:ribosome biogenesis GTPase